jgi:hypothetical protein
MPVPMLTCETVSNLGGLPAMVRAVDRVEHRESGMIRVAMTYRLCSPPRFETVSYRGACGGVGSVPEGNHSRLAVILLAGICLADAHDARLFGAGLRFQAGQPVTRNVIPIN